MSLALKYIGIAATFLFLPNHLYAQQGIAATKSIVKTIVGVSMTGTVKVKHIEETCRAMIFVIDAELTGPGVVPEHFEIFYPGLRFQFTGKVCLPSSGNLDNLGSAFDYKPTGQVKVLVGKGIRFEDKIRYDGVMQAHSDKKEPLITITGTENAPLILEMTSGGFVYKSGRGTVQVPQGRIYRFGK